METCGSERQGVRGTPGANSIRIKTIRLLLLFIKVGAWNLEGSRNSKEAVVRRREGRQGKGTGRAVKPGVVVVSIVRRPLGDLRLGTCSLLLARREGLQDGQGGARGRKEAAETETEATAAG